MGTSTIMLGFQLQDGVTRDEVWDAVPDILSLAMSDVTIVHAGNRVAKENNLAFAVGSSGRSQAMLFLHKKGLLTIDIQHECDKDGEVLPMGKPYNMEYIRALDSKIRDRLGDMLLHSCSLHLPIRRPCRLPRNYTELGDERLYETDYTHTLCDVMSPYQRVRIAHSRECGAVLCLDEDIMIAESDEIEYTHTVLGLDRGNDYGGKTVLILGGGDGGILNTLTSLPDPPSHVLMAEIDEEVMKACARHMRSVCGNVLDTYNTDMYKIEVRDCVEVLKECVEDGRTFDYVINDLTEFSVQKEKYGFSYDFKTNNVLMELSYQCLTEGGKYLARGNCLSASAYLKTVEEELADLGFDFKRINRYVPSYRETINQTTKPSAKPCSTKSRINDIHSLMPLSPRLTLKTIMPKSIDETTP